MTKLEQKIRLTAVCKRPGVYQVKEVILNADSAEDAIRKYSRRKK